MKKEDGQGKNSSREKRGGVFSRVRDTLAIDAAKAVAAGSRLAGNQGSSITGKAAMKLSPSVLADLAGQVRKTTFAVCGTNGKTTTNNLLCTMLESTGAKVICNRLGANMLPGVTAAYVQACGAGGRLDADHACLEVDEASAHLVFQHVRPDYLILTNLFRDQLDRYGEIDITIDLLKQAISLVPDMKLIVNADDPLSVYLANETGNSVIFYGIPKQIGTHAGEGESHEIRESGFCKVCGAPLEYAFYHYSQMGMYHCTACSFGRPAAKYEAENILLADGISFDLEGHRIQSQLAGEYSIYNLLGVWSALRESGEDLTADSFNEVLLHYRPQFGRNEHFHIDGHEIILNLAKNPAGFNQNIVAMLEDRDPKRLVIVINDNDQDGTDVSWLWDVDFDRVQEETIRSVTVSGIRALDMGLRLKYVGIEAGIAATPEKVIEEQLAAGPEKLYVLVNYTALFSIQVIIKIKTEKISTI